MDWALTWNLTGSEMTKAPLGTRKSGLPEKVTVLALPGLMALEPAPVPDAGSATVAAVMGRSEPPKALLKLSRMVEASWVM